MRSSQDSPAAGGPPSSGITTPNITISVPYQEGAVLERGGSWRVWIFLLKWALRSAGCWHIATGLEVEPEKTLPAPRLPGQDGPQTLSKRSPAEFRRLDMLAMHIITSRIQVEDFIGSIHETDTAVDLLQALQGQAEKRPLTAFHDYLDLINVRRKNFRTTREFTTAFADAKDDCCRHVGKTDVSEYMLVHIFLHAMAPTYGSWVEIKRHKLQQMGDDVPANYLRSLMAEANVVGTM